MALGLNRPTRVLLTHDSIKHSPFTLVVVILRLKFIERQPFLQGTLKGLLLLFSR